MTAQRAQARDPFASFDLDSLLTGAARLRPDRTAIEDSSGGRLTYADLDRRSASLAAHLRELGLQDGETILIVGGAHISTVLATTAGVRAGLDVALAPAHLDAAAMGVFAAEVEAAAIAAEPYGELALPEEMFAAAANGACVRFICSLGGGADEAVDLDWRRLADLPTPKDVRPAAASGFLCWSAQGVRRHEQHALVAAGLELLSRARIGMRDPIVSTLAPVSFAGLAAGPFAALLAGCALHLHGPFDGAKFLADFDARTPAHVVGPQALAQALAAYGPSSLAAAASLMLTRNSDPTARLARPEVPVIDMDLIELAGAPGGIFSR